MKNYNKNKENRNLYSAHERTAADSKMFLKMFFIAFIFGMILVIIINSVVFKHFQNKFSTISCKYVKGGLPKTVFRNYFMNKYVYNKIPFFKFKVAPEPILQKILGKRVSRHNYNVFVDKLILEFEHDDKNIIINSFTKMKKNFYISLIFLVCFIIFYILFFFRQSVGMNKDKFLRGAELLKNPEFFKRLKDYIKKEDKNNIIIGKLIIPRELEVRHIFSLGATGSGKSNFINQIIDQILKRKKLHKDSEQCIIYDVKGSCVRDFYNEKRGDKIFYPFDQRSVSWRFFNEFLLEDGTIDYPILDVCSTLLFNSESSNDDKNYFYLAAADVFKTGVLWLHNYKKFSNRDILEFFNQDTKFIIKCFKELPLHEQSAIKHITSGDQSAGVMGTLQERLRFFKYILDDGGEFSFRNFIKDDKNKQNLFLMNLPEYGLIFKPLITFVLDLMINTTLTLEDSTTRRIPIIIDELASLYKLDKLFDFQTLSRSKGGFLVASTQDFGKFKKIYGEDLKETFLNNFGILAAFITNSPNTKKDLSSYFGKQEIASSKLNRSMSPSDVGDRVAYSTDEKEKTIILDSEFNNLNIGECFLKVTQIGSTKYQIPFYKFEPLNLGFIRKEFENFHDFPKKDYIDENDIDVNDIDIDDNEDNASMLNV